MVNRIRSFSSLVSVCQRRDRGELTPELHNFGWKCPSPLLGVLLLLGLRLESIVLLDESKRNQTRVYGYWKRREFPTGSP